MLDWLRRQREDGGALEEKASAADMFTAGTIVTTPVAASAPPRAGVTNVLLNYSKMPWLRGIVGKVGSSVAEANWRIFVPTTGANGSTRAVRNKSLQRMSKETRDLRIKQMAEKGELQEITDHPLLDLLNHGNLRMSGFGVFETTSHHVDLVGEAFWLLERDQMGLVTNIWPLPPSWTKELPTKAKPFYTVDIGGQRWEIPPSEIIPFIKSDPADPYSRGSGIARALADELESDEYAAKHLKAYFLNGAKPDFVVIADGLQAADTAAFEQGWLTRHQGFLRRYLPAFINKKVEIKELSHNMRNTTMKDLRMMMRDFIMQVYNIPPEKMGVLAASNRATIQAADFFWTKDIIAPRMEFLRMIMQMHLVPIYDERLILDYDSPIVQDREHKLSVMRTQPGAFTVNEWREEAQMPTIGDDGEVYLVNPGVVATEDPGNIPEESQPDPPSATDFDEPLLNDVDMQYIHEETTKRVVARLKDTQRRQK